MRRPLIAANWKMNHLLADSISFFKLLNKKVNDYLLVDVAVCPQATLLRQTRESAIERILIGGQNCHHEPSGAYTGEISAAMLKDAGAQIVILGHSERRRLFSETNEDVNKKVIICCEEGVHPILCIGESQAQRDKGLTFNVLQEQLKKCLMELPIEEAHKVTIAYEPIWAISGGDATKKSATPEDAQEAHNFIRRELSKIFTHDIAQKIRILYGGSMKPENVEALIRMPDLDGGLVGGASLDPGKFLEIIAKTHQYYSSL